MNVEDKASLGDFLKGCQIVIHGGTPFQLDVKDPKTELFDPTIEGTKNFLELAKQTDGIEQVVFIASVAAEDNAFWRMQLPDFSSLASPYKELFPMTYSLNEEVSSRYFFDLLPIHELGHTWATKAGLNTQRLWLSEMLCNLMLHTFIAEERGEFLGALELLPMHWSNEDQSNYVYTSLEQFQDNYWEIGTKSPRNYAWYQYRFHNAARKLYNEGGADVLINL